MDEMTVTPEDVARYHASGSKLLAEHPGVNERLNQMATQGFNLHPAVVRVLGLPPRVDDSQFIDLERITDAQKREVAVLHDEPLIAGVDLAWGGEDFNVIRFRRGRDARSIPAIRIPGAKTRDASIMVVKLSDLLTHGINGQAINTMFIDSAGISGAVGSRLRELGHSNVIEINFGADSPDQKYRNMRAMMWGRLKDFLLTGAIDSHPRLESDLTGPGYELDSKVRIQLESKDEMKKRGLDSPDDADALALTFAVPVAPPEPARWHEEDYGPRYPWESGWLTV